MARLSKGSNTKCKLPPFKIEEVISVQSAQQQLGWNISSFDIPNAWNLAQGEGVKIAVIDTGVDLDHQDLVGNLLPGINLLAPNTPPKDDNGHGTHSIGIICAQNNEIGVVGVAPNCKVIPIKALDKKGNGSLPIVAQGIRWAVDNGADIISMSLGAPKPMNIILKAIMYAESKGIPIFAAAGNSGMTKQIFYPANYKQTISIGSIDENFDRSKFSNTGNNLDFLAPGGSILSTIPKNWYGIMHGTSMAAPWAAGVAALCLSYQRKHAPDKPLIGSNAYRELFKHNTIPIKNPKQSNNKFFQGFGIIDPRKLLEKVS